MPAAFAPSNPAATVAAILSAEHLRLVNETRLVSQHVGGRGDMAFPVNSVALVDGHRITRHDYGFGAEYECDCSATTCAHLALYLAHAQGAAVEA